MDRHDVASALTEIGSLLELTGVDTPNVRAYHAAARAITSYDGDLIAARRSGALGSVLGVDPDTVAVIQELIDRGQSRILDDLRDRVPPGLGELLRIDGLGVAKVRLIHERLHVDSLADLEAAARDGRLAELPRFGSKTADQILRSIAFLRQAAGMLLVHHARRDAEALMAGLAGLAPVDRVALAGSMRRRCELVGDLDIVMVTAARADHLLDAIRGVPDVAEATRTAPDALRLRLESGAYADVYLTPPQRFGLTLLHATGSWTHIEQLAARAAERGITWDRVTLWSPAGTPPLGTEADVYRALGLPLIPPELREGVGEVEVAAAGRLPTLVEPADVRGLLHCHSTYSDGASGVAEWAVAARAAGYAYLGITDHSPATAFGSALAPEDVHRQHAEIDAVNRGHEAFRVLKGVEADILPDGTLDYTPALRRSFDFIIASVHTRHGMSAEEMTARILSAMDDPTMTVLGHPTGRLLLSREPFALDIDAIFARAASRDIAIEINADPLRLDLDWRLLQRARRAGVTISIGADAHRTGQIHHMEFGLGIARKGWLTSGDLLNTRSAEDFLSCARRRRE